MIQIEFESEKETIKSVTVSGHANYSEYGEDIVCAAVSSQIISVENSLQLLLDHQLETEVDELQGGFVKITMPDELTRSQAHDSQVLLKHLYLAYQVLADNYPEYIQLKSHQVNQQ